MWMRALAMAGVALVLTTGCGEERLPSRDEIPILRERVFLLEQAILRRSAVAVDSLASSEILDAGQSSDSLLGFVYGADGQWPFRKFDDYSIFYNNDLAVVSCVLADSAGQSARPVKLIYRKHDKTWLLKSFQAVSDSVENR